MNEETISVNIDRVGLIPQPKFAIGQTVKAEDERQLIIGLTLNREGLCWNYATLDPSDIECEYSESAIELID